MQIVGSNGSVDYSYSDGRDGVRRSDWVKCNKVGITPKLESPVQKNKQPFFTRNCKDKYKGKNYYDRR